MRWTTIFFCCLFLAAAFVGAAAPSMASDLEPPRQAYPEDGPSDDYDKGGGEQLAEFCYEQRRICRKICYLRFRDDQIGCPQQCESRVSRCTRTGCYRWSEPELLIAERFGGYKCPI
jgi:hypothetical protein